MAKDSNNVAQDLFEDMGRKVQNMELSDGGPAQTEQQGDEEGQKMVEEIESLCMNCHSDGTTRLLLTKVPFFREIVVMSFSCPECGFKNSEIQSAGEIQQRGSRYVLKVTRKEDLNRQLVKSDTAVVQIEEIELEIPAGRGQLTNVEGILSMVKEDLEQGQKERKAASPEIYEKINRIIENLAHLADGSRLPFTISIDDPAGNSSIEPSMSDSAGTYTRSEYPRSAAQNAALGLGDIGPQHDDYDGEGLRQEYKASQDMVPHLPTGELYGANLDSDDITENQVYSFPASCPGCTKSCVTNMKMVNIPHFKQVVIMSTVCDHCGYRSNEVKTGGEVPKKGRRITVSVESAEDLTRDILKSESCAVQCPELSLSVEPGTLGGRFTTIEGLLTQVRDDLRKSIFSIDDPSEEPPNSDSMPQKDKMKWDEFFGRLTNAIEGKSKFKVTLEDPLASSYVQSFKAPDPDPQVIIEDYDRTDEEEEHLGLKDIKTEGYEEDATPST